ncbi:MULTISPECIES: TetR/AcrR family transcriptional regulator [unclassified Leucobacter]|uniref:TetR/AcrR family transcriptional regulator n=1 Tax=unclassified Leucobacter TaxID=2621730 RepID=UPI003016C135
MPKIVDHDARREQIAEAAWQIIARDGFDKLTMRRIAAEVGTTHSAFARYFPDKESLLMAAFLRTRELADTTIAARTAGRHGIDALREFCLAVLPFGDNGTLHARVGLAFWNHAAQHRPFWKTQREHAQRWRTSIMTMLEEAREAGEIPAHIDLTTASDEIAAANMGWQTIKLLMPEFATDERMRASLDTLLSSIGSTTHPSDGRAATHTASRDTEAPEHPTAPALAHIPEVTAQ